MVATEPLDQEFWQTAGLERRQTFSDMRHLVIYGQRTADDRIAFGGRGAPYHFGSAIKPAFDQDLDVHAVIRSTLIDLFPALEKKRITHPMGRTTRDQPRLAPVGWPRSSEWNRVGGRLCGRRCVDGESRRPDPRRPDPRPRHRTREPPVGGAPVTEMGARADSMDRGQLRIETRRRRGPSGRENRAPVAQGGAVGTTDRVVTRTRVSWFARSAARR